MEGNPLIGWLMAAMGEGPALTAAKLAAAACSASPCTSPRCTTSSRCSRRFYVAVAVVPWIAVLFYF